MPVQATPPYLVESVPGCPYCDLGHRWIVIGPDGVTVGASFNHEDRANTQAAEMNDAYAAGVMAVRRELNRAVGAFAEDDSKGAGELIDVIEPFLLRDEEVSQE